MSRDVGELDVDALKARARAGDAQALQTLRDAGFFKKRVRRDRAPVSHGQRRLWTLDRLAEAGTAYSMPAGIRLRGRLSREALRQAVARLITRHETLRTRFELVDDEPVQCIDTPENATYELVDVSQKDMPWNAALEWMQADAARAFDLQRGPLVRFALLQLADNDAVFYYNLHHIIGDEWSLDVLARELLSGYSLACGGGAVEAVPLEYQYQDYVRALAKELTGERLVSHRSYWHDRLGGSVSTLELRTDFPRPPIKQFRGGVHELIWGTELREGLRALETRCGLTPFMGALAFVGVLMHRYSGQDDLLLGAPISGRDQPGVSELIGFFVNTLVLRLTPSSGTRFVDFAESVKAECLNAFSHQSYPFDGLVDELGLARDMSRNPLFDVAVLYQQADDTVASIAGLEMEAVDLGVLVARFDLTFVFQEDGNGLGLRIEYDADLFAPETMARMATALDCLIRGILTNPASRLGDLPLMPSGEVDRLRNGLAFGESEAGVDGSVIDLFETQVRVHPDAIAVEDADGEPLTYAQLNRRANAAAEVLVAAGVGVESIVGLAASDGFDVSIGILAILKIGAVYLPLDAAFPVARLEYMLENSQAKFVLCDEHSASVFEPLPAAVLRVDEIRGENADPPEVVVEQHAEQLRYLIYTSGSTGQPKGAALTDQGLKNLWWDQRRRLDLKPGSRMLQFASLCFDASIWEMFSTLLSGGTVVFAERDAKMPGVPLARLCRERRITHLLLPPSALAQMPADSLEFATHLVLGGEACRRELVDQWSEDRSLFNAYGPTEDTVIATMSGRLEAGASLAIGRPLTNTEVLILDERLSPQPIGLPGEIYIGGAGLARGYVNSAGLTADRFVPHPWRSGERLYRSGDEGRFLEDGTIEFLGRRDFQVKHRGFRIELGDIEAHLGTFPGVIDAAVIQQNDGAGDAVLVAYPVFEPGGDLPERAALRQFLKERLPAYCLPDRFFPLATPPRTASGKLDRRRLPELAKEGRPNRAVVEPPRNSVEESICRIWSEVLATEVVGIGDDFFELGGNSLKAIQIVSRIERDLERELKVRDVFQFPTVRELAARIDALDSSSPVSNIPVAPPQALYEVSHAQRRLWVIERMAGEHAAYNLNFCFRLRGTINVSLLEKALQGVVDRHESLRTVFLEENGQPKQRILEALEIGIGNEESGVDVSPEEWVLQHVVRGFDLETGPLLRAVCLRLGNEEVLLLVQLHHIVGDGWSLDILIREWLLNYRALLEGRALGQIPLPIQYKDFAWWQNRLLESDEAGGARQYWATQLAGDLPVLNLTTDRPRPSVQQFDGAVVRGRLEPDLVEGLTRLVRNESTSLFVGLLSVTRALLYRYTGQSDVVLGTPVAGRIHPETEALIGFFANMLPLRTKLDAGDSFRSLLKSVRATVDGAIEHQAYPFDRMVEDLDVMRDMARSPVFDVVVSLQNLSPLEASLEGIEAEAFGADSPSAKFDLTFFFYEEADGSVDLAIEYSTALFDRRSIEEMRQHLIAVAQQVIAEPEQPIGRLELLSKSEENRFPTGVGPL